MRRDDQRQAVKNIPLEQLKPFKNHPFQVRDDEEFRRLVESIEIHGVIHPAVARQIGEDCYELISGHRRKAACEVLGYLLENQPAWKAAGAIPIPDAVAIFNLIDQLAGGNRFWGEETGRQAEDALFELQEIIGSLEESPECE